MAVNKKRDKKNLLNYIACANEPPNFMKQRMMKKQQKFKPKEGVVDFMDNDDRKVAFNIQKFGLLLSKYGIT